jgi:S1-C subfamily serine protease
MLNSFLTLSQSIASLAAAASPRVASVWSRRKGPIAGLLLDRNRIVTLDHGIEPVDELHALLPDGNVAAISLLGRDSGADLALLTLDSFPSDIPPIKTASNTAPGELILALSRHHETGLHAAIGNIQAVAGPWRTWQGGKLDSFVQLPTAPPSIIYNAAGELLGLSSPALIRGASALIPVTNLERFLDTVERHHGATRGYLGIGLQPIPQPAGMIVLSVEPESPSAQANLMVGDIILSIAGKPTPDFHHVQELLDPANIGRQLPLQLLRGGVSHEILIQVGARRAA